MKGSPTELNLWPHEPHADAFRVGHRAYKFVLDFGQLGPDREKSQFHTRVVMGPDDAKAFSETFGQAIEQYEDQYGQINESD